ncbi:MopE-related protein, partial [Flavobacterium orientale]|uniref:MopE-related protein n=1 Tax=Flavobacterium orientale TaxID=1756020 RepID=UPI001E3289CD
VLSGVTLSSSLNSTVTDAQGYYAIELVYGDVLTLSKADYLDLVSEPFFESLPNFDFLLTSVCSFVNCPPGTACEQGGCFPIVYVVSGVVRDNETLEPLSGVTISYESTTVQTDSQGFYSITVLYGAQLTLTYATYQTLVSNPLIEFSGSTDFYLTSMCLGVVCPPGFACNMGGCYEIDPCSAEPPVLFTWYLDTDGDEYYTGDPISSCESPGDGYTTTVLGSGDCNDNDASIYPGAPVICYDNISQDCNTDIYDGCAIVLSRLRNDNCGAT